jgi:hypothetical protein
MAKTRHVGMSNFAFLRLFTGIFFVILGITGVLPESEGIFSLSRNQTTLEIVFGVIELLCGLFLVLDSFRSFPRKTSVSVLLVILCLWVLRIIITQFIQGIAFRSQGMLFHPTFWRWLANLSVYLLVASDLWVLYKVE